jgi:hypothetical protein
MPLFKSFLKVAFVSAVLAGLSACSMSEDVYATVAVYPSKQQCAIDEQYMNCGEVGEYLRDTLKVGRNRVIFVSAVGMDPIPKDDTSLDLIAQRIRNVGYTDVRTANFDLH